MRGSCARLPVDFGLDSSAILGRLIIGERPPRRHDPARPPRERPSQSARPALSTWLHGPLHYRASPGPLRRGEAKVQTSAVLCRPYLRPNDGVGTTQFAPAVLD